MIYLWDTDPENVFREAGKIVVWFFFFFYIPALYYFADTWDTKL